MTSNHARRRVAATMLVGVAVATSSCGSGPLTPEPSGGPVAPGGTAGTAAADPGPSSPAVPATAAPIRSCTSTELRVTLTHQTVREPGRQIVLELRFTNQSTRPCSTQGYPGATLHGPDIPGLGPDFVLRRSTTSRPEPITLAPGQTAAADLTVMVVSAANGWLPQTLLTTAPDDTVAVAVPWPTDLPVSRQDGATRPATYIGPLV